MSGPARPPGAFAAAFALGLIFAFGLGISGMTRPEAVLGFLDLGGRWSPRLAFVMAAAIGVGVVAYRAGRGWSRPWLAEAFPGRPRETIDRRLIGGAAVFGVGWGIAGVCPGPAVVDLATGSPDFLAFFAAMAVGLGLGLGLDRRTAPRPPVAR